MVAGSSGSPWTIASTRFKGPLHEAVEDLFVDQGAARTGADLALVEREHDEALDRLVEEIVILGHDVLEEDVGRLAAEFERHRNQVLARVLHDQPARRRLAGEGDLGDARRGRQRLAGLETEAVDDVEHAGRQAGRRSGLPTP
jgi:ParB family chromosome partitioning protein